MKYPLKVHSYIHLKQAVSWDNFIEGGIFETPQTNMSVYKCVLFIFFKIHGA